MSKKTSIIPDEPKGARNRNVGKAFVERVRREISKKMSSHRAQRSEIEKLGALIQRLRDEEAQAAPSAAATAAATAAAVPAAADAAAADTKTDIATFDKNRSASLYSRIERSLERQWEKLTEHDESMKTFMEELYHENGAFVAQLALERESYDAALMHQLALESAALLKATSAVSHQKDLIPPHDAPQELLRREDMLSTRLHDQVPDEAARIAELPKWLRKDPSVMCSTFSNNIFHLSTLTPYGNTNTMLGKRKSFSAATTAKHLIQRSTSSMKNSKTGGSSKTIARTANKSRAPPKKKAAPKKEEGTENA